MHTQRKRLSAATVLFLVAAMLFAGLLVLVPRAAATHDTVPWSRPYWVATTVNNESYSSVLADGNGTFYVFYLRTDRVSDLTDVYQSKWVTRGASGNPEVVLSNVLVNVNNVGEVVVNDPFFGLPQTPVAAIDHAGNLYVAWTSTAYDVYVSKSNDGGETWLPAVLANSATATAWDFGPSIAITGAGASERIWVAWSQFWLTGPGFFNNATVSYSVNQAATFIGYTNASGQPGTSTLILSTDLAADSQGRLYLTYTAIDITTFMFYANYTWSDTGSSWAAPTSLNSSAGGFLPAISVDSKDRVHIAWFDGMTAPTGPNLVYYTRSDDRGASWTIAVPITQGRVGFGGEPLLNIVVHEDEVMVAWTGQTFTNGVAYVISADGGDVWYPEAFYAAGAPLQNIRIAADENGTYYATFTQYNEFFANYDVGFVFWDGPPSAPVITNIARGTGSLTVTWSPSPEPDVVLYRVWRSVDGFSYGLVATVSPGTTSYADTGLANGTYWYRVTAFDRRGTSSHASEPMSATVGLTTEEMIDLLEAQIAATQATIAQLQADLAAAQTDIDDLQGRLTQLQTDLASLQNDLDSLQSDVDANDAATQQRLNDLENQIDSLQNQL
ncbi:MAG TPA: hypothetical protein VIL58_02455, partial [Thermoplasmata archaeon]